MAGNPNWESDWKAAKERLDRQKTNFADALDAFIKEKVPEAVRIATKKIAGEVFNRVCEHTPVDTGHARANWNIAIGKADLTIHDDNERNKEEPERFATVNQALRELSAGEPVVVSNNVGYIGVLERGWSDKAPHGMLGRTLDEVRVSIEKGNREK